MDFKNTTALIIGGSLGVGRSLAMKLSGIGARTIAVARNRDRLDDLKSEATSVEIVATDASADGIADKLLADYAPNLLILAGGHRPTMKPLSENTWEEFSATWKADTKIAFEFSKAMLHSPNVDGATVISFASGAALAGSPLSGGYAGAKRMQHFISDYAMWEAGRRGSALNFLTVYPKQLIAGSSIAEDVSAAYAAAASITPEQFMDRWDKPLTADDIADHVIGLLESEGDLGPVYGVTGAGIEAMA